MTFFDVFLSLLLPFSISLLPLIWQVGASSPRFLKWSLLFLLMVRIGLLIMPDPSIRLLETDTKPTRLKMQYTTFWPLNLETF